MSKKGSSNAKVDQPAEEVRVGEEVCVHFKQRAPLQNEGRQNHFGQVHSNLYLGIWEKKKNGELWKLGIKTP